MTRPEHPVWCARSRCTAALGGIGEHRSAPTSWRTHYGSLIATLVQRSHARTAYLELRITITIPATETAARQQAAAIAAGVHHAITAATVSTPQRRTR